jgi:hypothetical protein
MQTTLEVDYGRDSQSVRAKRTRVSVGAGVSGIRVPYLDQLRKHTMGASSVFSCSLRFPSMAITTNPSPEPAGSFDHKLDMSVPE